MLYESLTNDIVEPQTYQQIFNFDEIGVDFSSDMMPNSYEFHSNPTSPISVQHYSFNNVELNNLLHIPGFESENEPYFHQLSVKETDWNLQSLDYIPIETEIESLSVEQTHESNPQSHDDLMEFLALLVGDTTTAPDEMEMPTTRIEKSSVPCKKRKGKKCSHTGCEQFSQGGGFCIKHGGGRICSKSGCQTTAQSNSLCKRHGGGARCAVKGCEKSSQGQKKCRDHGGGPRCTFPNCRNGRQFKTLCVVHGGNRKCTVENCHRNDRGGGLCGPHRRHKLCSFQNCRKIRKENGLCISHNRKQYSVI